VLAALEKLLQVTSANAISLARTAWQLGSDHVPTEIGKDFLRVAADDALAEQLRKSGVVVAEFEAPFEPEVDAGAPHDHGHEHGHGDPVHGHRHKH